MIRPTAAITGVSGYLPPYVLTNQELERMVDTNDEWIVSRTGIRERHILKGDDQGTSVMAVEAVRELLRKTKTAPEEVDLLICATVTPDMIFPATANIICDQAGITKAFSYDIEAACSGFLYALTTGAMFVESGRYRKVIIVGADKMSAIVDYTDRNTCVLFGDGAGAVMLEPNTDGYGILDHCLHSDGIGAPYLHQKAGGSRRPPSAMPSSRQHRSASPFASSAASSFATAASRSAARAASLAAASNGASSIVRIPLAGPQVHSSGARNRSHSAAIVAASVLGAVMRHLS